MANRKAIRLKCRERSLLVELYLEFRYPSDQYKRRARHAAAFLRRWNKASGRADTWEEVIHYIITQRKQGKWVTFGDDYKPQAEPDWNLLDECEWSALEQAYTEVVLVREIASDNLVYDRKLAAALADRFAELTGRKMRSMDLAALVMSKRKKGEWVRLKPKEEGLGFSDIDDVT